MACWNRAKPQSPAASAWDRECHRVGSLTASCPQSRGTPLPGSQSMFSTVKEQDSFFKRIGCSRIKFL